MKKEIIKPFDLEAYKKGAKVKTRNGQEVRIICTNYKNEYFPIIALVKINDNNEVVLLYTSKGKVQPTNKIISNNDLVIVEEVEEPEFWSDKKYEFVNGYFIGDSSNIIHDSGTRYTQKKYSYFATRKQVKSALAMARISQIMANDIENFGGAITDEEWKNDEWKYVIYRNYGSVNTTSVMNDYYFLAFHTAEQRDLFLEKYRDLVRDYLCLD